MSTFHSPKAYPPALPDFGDLTDRVTEIEAAVFEVDTRLSQEFKELVEEVNWSLSTERVANLASLDELHRQVKEIVAHREAAALTVSVPPTFVQEDDFHLLQNYVDELCMDRDALTMTLAKVNDALIEQQEKFRVVVSCAASCLFAVFVLSLLGVFL